MTRFFDGAQHVEPQLPVTAVKTYQLAAPRSTHFRPATCREVDCPAYLAGWMTTCDPDTEVGQAQIGYITRVSGRAFTYELQESGLWRFTFAAGQTCFAEHVLPREREPLYIVRDGDWRGNPSGDVRRHTRATDWVDDFANHQQKLADRLEQG